MSASRLGVNFFSSQNFCNPQQPENQPTTPNDMHPIAPQRRPFRPHFTYLYRLVLTRSRWPELAKANHFLAHLALLVGPEALSRPATAQNSLGRGRSPPCAKAEKNRGPQPKHRFSSHVFALGLTFLFLFVFSPTSFCRPRLPFASFCFGFWVSFCVFNRRFCQ